MVGALFLCHRSAAPVISATPMLLLLLLLLVPIVSGDGGLRSKKRNTETGAQQLGSQERRPERVDGDP